ncbi:MAG: BatD family protein, partial [Thiotrichaceae bacterium]|nr:BatD family protein [Thiotrichaceae bacterium]
FINGNTSSSHTWNISLLAKKTGEISIPAIKVGDEYTDPIHLIIRPSSTTPGLDGKEAFLKISLSDNDQNEFYVQQQIFIIVQLFHRIRFSNASLSELELNNSVIEKLGEDNHYNKIIGKHRYNIIERKYAIYPQQSGELIIPALTFTGNIEVRQNFSLFSQAGRQIMSRTDPVKLNILPIPQEYTGKNWLPAESLEIKSEILEDISTIIAGEAITRHIIVRAKGLLGSQLPVSSVSSSKTIKAYPDKEELKNQLVSGEIFGVRRDTVAIIPLKPGSFTLPEITINWWNTKTNQQESTYLPARPLFAQPNSEQAEQIQSNQQSSSQPQIQTQLKKSTDTVEKGTEKTIETIIKKELVYKQAPLTKNLWFWVSIALLIIWLTTLTLLITAATRSKRSAAIPSASEKTPLDNSQADKTLQLIYDACKNNNAHNASKSLVQWAKFHFKQPMIAGLSAVIELIDNDLLVDAIVNLESCQYSQDKEKWQGDDLSSNLKQYLQQNKAEKEADKNKESQAFSSLNP